jgi:hypothetical protein
MGNHARPAQWIDKGIEKNIGESAEIDNRTAARHAGTRSMSIKTWHQRPHTEEMK